MVVAVQWFRDSMSGSAAAALELVDIVKQFPLDWWGTSVGARYTVSPFPFPWQRAGFSTLSDWTVSDMVDCDFICCYVVFYLGVALFVLRSEKMDHLSCFGLLLIGSPCTAGR